MIVFAVLFAAVCLWQVKVKPTSGTNYMTDYMSVEKTMAIKGIFILIVFVQHFNSYVTFEAPLDKTMYTYFNAIGQIMVTMFLFYSGYGVMESIKKKKMDYVQKIPVKRILSVLFRFDIAIILFGIADIAIGNEFTLKQFLLSLVAWDSIGNSNWYIFAIIVSYLFTYLAFQIFGEKGKFIPGAVTVLVLTLCFVFFFGYFKIKGTYWYDTILCYPIGIMYSLFREKIEKFVNKNIFIYLLILAVFAGLTVITHKYMKKSFVFDQLCMIFAMITILLVTMKISFNNAVLRWFGKNLFGIYILQRIPMIVLKHLLIDTKNLYGYFALCFLFTVLLAWLFEKTIGNLWAYLTTHKKNTEINKY